MSFRKHQSTLMSHLHRKKGIARLIVPEPVLRRAFLDHRCNAKKIESTGGIKLAQKGKAASKSLNAIFSCPSCSLIACLD